MADRIEISEVALAPGHTELEVELARPTPVEATFGRGTGWLPDLPDVRDYTPANEQVHEALRKAQAGKPRATLPKKVDLRPWCSPIEDQGQLGSCTAHAGVALYEYFERRAFGNHLDASRLFLYKVTRNLLHWRGDTGAFVRAAMGAMRLFGLPPEEYWPYSIKSFDVEPSPFCYAFAQAFQALVYYRLDDPALSTDQVLARIKTNLASGLPAMFGFTVYASIAQAARDGKIPLPSLGDKTVGGHAVAAVGYDDAIRIRNGNGNGRGRGEARGAFLIRNSWGPDWGDHGYGWLPYDYLRRGLALDWWSMLKGDWVETGAFRQDYH
jgi:C1A family cysteine protease